MKLKVDQSTNQNTTVVNTDMVIDTSTDIDADVDADTGKGCLGSAYVSSAECSAGASLRTASVQVKRHESRLLRR